MPHLKTEDLSFQFGDREILNRLTFSCAPGDFVSFLGESGCGKSTLLRLIAGLLQPSSGTLTFSAPARTGFVFQQPTLCPWRTTSSNVELPLQLLSTATAERRRRVRDSLTQVGLTAEDGGKWPRQLSGGMQMRASVARALVNDPEVLLMDEPFAALDEVLRQELGEMILDVWRQRRPTTIFVTHNVSEAVFLSRRVFILSARPARIAHCVEIPFTERTAALRTDLSFLKLVADVSQRLRDVVTQSRESTP